MAHTLTRCAVIQTQGGNDENSKIDDGSSCCQISQNLYSAIVHRTSPKPVVKAIHPEVEDSKRRINCHEKGNVFWCDPIVILFSVGIKHTPSPKITRDGGYPTGAKVRLGKGQIYDLKYSPDGTRLAVTSSIGIWLYDTVDASS